MKPSPYETDPTVLRERLADPSVNVFEHEVNWPRLKAMLPVTADRILDFGCGAGNFTEEIAARYPNATVLGVDAAEAILPGQAMQPNLAFKAWDGSMPLEIDQFDLIIAKMSLHYLDEVHFRAAVANVCRLLTRDGTIVISVPHPANVWPQNTAKRDRYSAFYQPGNYTRAIGSTGIQGTMVHRSLSDWVTPFSQRLNRGWGNMALDEPVDEHNMPKRLNIAFLPLDSDEDVEIRKRLAHIEKGTGCETVIMVDIATAEGRHLLNGTHFSAPQRPLP